MKKEAEKEKIRTRTKKSEKQTVGKIKGKVRNKSLFGRLREQKRRDGKRSWRLKMTKKTKEMKRYE